MRTLFASTLVFMSLVLAGQTYTEYSVGSTADLNILPSGGICLMGGATENDNASRWFLQQANEGDIVVLRASGSDGYNSYFFSQLGVNLNSVKTFVCHSRMASFNPNLLLHISNAEAIWFAGGDQWDYISYWQDTPLDSIIRHKIQNENLVIGGTSAGMAILGEARFSAQTGTVTSNQVLSNPYHANVQIDTSRFLSSNILDKVITDTHYDNPDRKGRHIGFMARLLSDLGWNEVKGIACDEYTAVCIDTNGIAKVFGDYPTYDDNAYFLQSNCELNGPQPEICTPGQSLTWSLNNQAIFAYEVKGTSNGSNTFDLNNWKTGSGGQWKYWYVANGTLSTSSATSPACSSFDLDEFHNLADIYFESNSIHFTFHSLPPESIEVLSTSGKVLLKTNRIGSLRYSLPISFARRGVYLVRMQFHSTVRVNKLIIP